MATTAVQPAAPANEWAALHEAFRKFSEQQAEISKKQAELTEKQAELNKSQAELTKSQAETDRQMQETDRKIDKVRATLGSWANNHGSFAEEYFFNSFENGKQSFFGEKFDEVEKNVKGIKREARDEYDILLINGKSIGIVEVKYKAHENDVPKVLNKARTFRVNFPDYANHRVYLGLATLAFYPQLEQRCMDEGIAIIKQVGDTVVINDEHLKVF